MDWRVGLLALLAACGPAVEDKEICSNKLDDDANGLFDCEDPACVDAACVEVCEDGFDNNLDNAVDCADPQCDGRGCGEQCLDGRDNDRNGDYDCADAACAEACDLDGDGALAVEGGGDDCDDDDPAINPSADEVCDDIDNNCNGLVDREDPDILRSEVALYHLDIDGDGFGDPTNAVYACDPPYGRVADGSDCDDTDPDSNPATAEVCNGLDDNCDGLTDDQDPQVDLTGADTFYRDNDGDGLGTSAGLLVACNRPGGYALNDDDCDDTQASVLGPSLWLLDLDGDGYGAGVPTGPYGCTAPGPDYVPEAVEQDCADGDPAISPAATEICDDLVDSDCDGADCAQWEEDFESGALSADWTTGGNMPWLVQSSVVFAGSYSGASGNIGDNQTSWMEVTFDFPIGGEVSFQHSGETESNFDYLQFYIDGTQMLGRSGFWNWTPANYGIAPGTHTLEWRYFKDGSVSTGLDTVWVDDIVVLGGN